MLHTPAPEVLLVIEVALTSFDADSRPEANLYARYGLPEYWVVDGESLVTFAFRAPENVHYTEVTETPPDQPLEALRLPGFWLTMHSLKLDLADRASPRARQGLRAAVLGSGLIVVKARR
jgi:Uma2 family endonuclease